MELPKSFTTVTPLSKILAVILFVSLPFMGFYFGITYQSLLTINQNESTTSSNRPPLTTPTKKELVKSQIAPLVTSPTPFALTKDSLVGVWHQSEIMPSSWAERYYLYPPINDGVDGKYVYAVSEMDCENRDRGHWGTYKIEGNILILTIKTRKRWTGGRYIAGGGSCSSEKILVGASELVEPLKEPITERLEIKLPTQNYWRDKVLINEIPYWRFDTEAKFDVSEGFPNDAPAFGYAFEDRGQE